MVFVAPAAIFAKNALCKEFMAETNAEMVAMPRYWEIDFLRGISIVMMVFFHFLWDLNYFGFIRVSLYEGFWKWFQVATAGLFLLLVGVVLTINYNRKKENFERDFLARGARVFFLGIMLTIASWLLFPSEFIYFGILHLIGVSIILSIPLVQKKSVNLLLATIIIAANIALDLKSFGIAPLVWLGLGQPSATLDFFPVLPWFGAVLIGIFLGNFLYENKNPKIIVRRPENMAIGFAELLGKNSLLIYFVHQPVLFSLVYAASIMA